MDVAVSYCIVNTEQRELLLRCLDAVARDRYVRKHHGAGAALAVRWLTAWTYAVRSVLALAAPGHDARRYRRHVRATLFPGRGEGLAEAAADFNRGPRL